MKVRLTVYDWRRENPVSVAAYYHLMDKVSGAEWGSMDNVQRQHTVNQLLAPYNGTLCAFDFQHIVVEFDSQEDLTEFVLTWS